MIVLEYKDKKAVILGPEFNDSHAVDSGTIFKKAMDGTVRTHIKKAIHSKSFVISEVNRPIMKRIYDLLISCRGDQIKYTELFDPANPVIWTGKITSSTETIHQAVRNSRIAISFEGAING